VSPDGSQIAYGQNIAYEDGFSEIWVMRPGGEQPRKVLAVEPLQMVYLRGWSSDGRRILYVRGKLSNWGQRAALESLDLVEGKVTQLVSDSKLVLSYMGWSNGGACSTGARLIYSLLEPHPNNADSGLWELRVNTQTGEPIGDPRKITHWNAAALKAVNATADGKTLAIVRENQQTDALHRRI
jgi:hypothetical protein